MFDWNVNFHGRKILRFNVIFKKDNVQKHESPAIATGWSRDKKKNPGMVYHGYLYEEIRVVHRLETGISDRLRTSSGKSTGKICLDRIYDGVTYLSCRANNVHPWYKWRAYHQRYVYIHTYVHVWKILFFFFFQKCCVQSKHIHISLVSNTFLCFSVRWEDL